MEKGLKYAIFKTEWGFFGLLADNNKLLRTVLPMRSFQITKKYLLVGMVGLTREDKRLFYELQKSIRNYYKGTYVDLNKSFLSITYPVFGSFACKVIKVCKLIPVGRTLTYSQVAKKAGFPKAARAVGNVLAKNSLPLLIGCHRVVRADGKIGNFSAPGGARMKKKMLEHEKRIATKPR